MKITDFYPRPWIIKYLPEEHRPPVEFNPPEVSITGNVIRHQPGFDRGPEEEIADVTDANGQSIFGTDDLGRLPLSDEELKALVEQINTDPRGRDIPPPPEYKCSCCGRKLPPPAMEEDEPAYPPLCYECYETGRYCEHR